ncbi:phage tail tape measure protein [uncultured Mediterranean phage uvMED]|nr:phage tail tape measure protein [uncultured Mediterranean phage uvMED]
MAESVLRFKVETLDANAKIAHLTKKVRGLEVAVKNAGGSTRAAGTGFKAFAGGAQAASVGARGLGAALGAALGPITAVVAAAGSLGQVFGVLRQQDFAEAKVKSLGVNSQELKARLSDVSRELTGQASVVDLTSAAYDVASAGFTNAADAANILKAASQGATGGFSDINTVGDATTSVLNAYGLEADKASKLVDGFIQTQNDGKIVIGEYAANIAKVAPVAAALGVSLEEVNAAVAQITAGGQNAEVTFTALKTAFAQVAAGKVGKEFKALGIEINASTLKTDGLAGTLEKIKKSGADAGTVIKAFGTEAGPSILALLNDTEKYNKLLENQKKAQGAAAKAAFTASDTIDGQLKRLTTAFQNLFSNQSELGILLKETFKVAAVTVEVLAVAISNVLSPIRAIFAAVNQVGQAISEALGIEGLNAAFELEQGFQFVLGGVKQLGDFVIGVGVRIGQVVGGLAKLIITSGKGALDSVTSFFRSALEKIVGFIKGAYNLIPEPIRRFLEGGVAAATSFVGETVALGQGVTQGAAGAQQQQQQQEQQVAQNAVIPTGGKLNKKTKEQVDMSDKLLELNRRLREEKELGNEREIATLELMVERQKIAEGNLESNKKADALEQATFNFRKKIFAIDQKAADLAEQERTKREADEKARREADPGFQMKKNLEELVKLENQVAAGATAIGNAFANSFKGVITGSKTAQEALADMMSSVAEHFLDMAAQIIAQQIAMIIYGTIMKALGVSMPGGGGNMGGQNYFDPMTGKGVAGPNFGLSEGAFVSSPTRAVVGEGSEPEYIIPESKMRESMSRYAQGNRGGAVIPGGSNAEMSSEGGGAAVAAPIDVRYTVERINSVDYVTADEFQTGMRQAANQGAKQGEQQTLRRLQMSSGTRKRLGL